MNIKSVEKTEKNVVELEIEVTGGEFEEGMEKSYKKNAGRINVPGFRKGKAPRKMIERIYGASIFFEDAVSFCYPQAYNAAIDEKGLEPVDHPDVNVTDINEDGTGFTFKAKVTLKPEVSLGDYRGLSAARPSGAVSDGDIAGELSRMQKKASRLESVERQIKKGDVVVFDFEGFVDGEAFPGGKAEGYSLEIGSGQFIPGFEEQMEGLTPGTDGEVSVGFPEEYHAPELAGKDAVFKIKIHEVKQEVLPDLDDDFAKDVSEFDTLEALKGNISEKLEAAKKSEADLEFENSVFDSLLERLDADIPEIMIKNRIDRIFEDFAYRLSQQGMNIQNYLSMTGMSEDDMRASMHDRALREVKLDLAIEKIAELEAFEISEAELEEEYTRLAGIYGMEPEKIKEAVDPAGMKKDIGMKKAVALVKDAADVTEKAPEPSLKAGK